MNLGNFCWVFDGGQILSFGGDAGMNGIVGKEKGLIIKGEGKEMTVPCVEPGEGGREDYK
jgi:hypothetical protein